MKFFLSFVVLAVASQAVEAREHRLLNRLRGHHCPAAAAHKDSDPKACQQGPVQGVVQASGRIIEAAGFRLRSLGGGGCANGSCGVR